MGLFLPSAAVERVIDITPELLRELGVRGLILDVDNTLAEHGSPQPFAGTIEWSRRMADAGFGLIILSNNTHERVAPFAGRYRIPFLSMCMKPLPFAYWRGARRLGTKCRETAVVGDQIFTDVLGANLSRMRSILLTPVSEEKSLSFRIRRRLEKGIRRRIRQKGLGPEK
ncbi:MAG TPA: YqeG family HAD IIIA-type phosphatase [Candidatus Gallacutalibacter pullicola]|mgnify:FL=1|uniref:YqeG family HAD IIIA-type phosphatase n=1 Tax=Candidatus Gallacutalibacter pullicola TaxID=2840830 RepID=A0A9D1J1R3_9FIRM|nr:YqeG family HAD IIIA-type phosphatase [Candidatus Gallacutalibacter pullicola]